MNEQLRLNNEAHAQNLAFFAHVEELVRKEERVKAADLLMGFRVHERARLAARRQIGCAAVPSPHEGRYVALLCQVRLAILAAMQGEEAML